MQLRTLFSRHHRFCKPRATRLNERLAAANASYHARLSAENLRKSLSLDKDGVMEQTLVESSDRQTSEGSTQVENSEYSSDHTPQHATKPNIPENLSHHTSYHAAQPIMFENCDNRAGPTPRHAARPIMFENCDNRVGPTPRHAARPIMFENGDAAACPTDGHTFKVHNTSERAFLHTAPSSKCPPELHGQICKMFYLPLR